MTKVVLQGKGASKGVCKGTAIFGGAKRTALHVSKESLVVLVLKSLDREVYKLIEDNVVGVVAECGSVACHGAAILRELGIPCVVACSNALRAIPQGAEIEVNGLEGTVVLRKRRVHIVAAVDERVKPALQESKTSFEEALFVSSNKNTTPCFEVRRSKSVECYRPNRSYQLLRYDMLRHGWEESPRFLFGGPKCKLERSKNGVVLVHNAPRLDDICLLVLDNPDWVMAVARQREESISAWKSSLPTYYKKVNAKHRLQLLEATERLHDMYSGLLRYIYLTQFIADELVDKWMRLIEPLGKDCTEVVYALLTSEYVRRAVAAKIHPGRSTFWQVPSPDPQIWQGDSALRATIDGEETLLRHALNYSIRTGRSLIGAHCRYRLVVPLIYQMAEEHYYVSSSICSFINRAVDTASTVIFGQETRIEHRSKVFSFTWQEFRKALLGISNERRLLC